MIGLMPLFILYSPASNNINNNINKNDFLKEKRWLALVKNV